MTDEIEYCYSRDGEYYFDDLEDIIFDGDTHLQEDGEIYRAEKAHLKHSMFIDIDGLFDNMRCQAYDEVGEAADDYLNDISRDNMEELEEIIVKWLDERASIDFYGVQNSKKITLKEAKEYTV